MGQDSGEAKTARGSWVIMAGGTGGHIFPALAVAKALRERGCAVSWLGSAGSMEEKIAPENGFAIHSIHIKGVRRNGWARKLSAPFAVARATFEAARALRREGADGAIGFGGFVTFPGALAAKLLGKKVVCCEQNAVPGLANRLAGRFADVRLCAYPDAWGGAEAVGNPARAEFFELPSAQERFAGRSGPLRLLVVGGSQGAQRINETLPKALAALSPERRPEVFHQCGKGKMESTEKLYAQLGVEAQCVEFIDKMAERFAWADFAVCRGGSGTLFELAGAGLGAFVVPLPTAVDDHQTKNAASFCKAGAARIMAQGPGDAERWAGMIGSLDRGQCLAMAIAAKSLAKPDAASTVARRAEALLVR